MIADGTEVLGVTVLRPTVKQDAFLVGDREHQRWSMGAGCLVNWAATYDAAAPLNLAIHCLGDVVCSNVHANLPSEKDETRCGSGSRSGSGSGSGLGSEPQPRPH